MSLEKRLSLLVAARNLSMDLLQEILGIFQKEIPNNPILSRATVGKSKTANIIREGKYKNKISQINCFINLTTVFNTENLWRSSKCILFNGYLLCYLLNYIWLELAISGNGAGCNVTYGSGDTAPSTVAGCHHGPKGCQA